MAQHNKDGSSAGLSSRAKLAWNLKAWFGILMCDRRRGDEVVAMDFRRFLWSESAGLLW